VLGCFAGVVFAASSTPPAKQVLGEWRGTSTCADRKKYASCHDESVIYNFAPSTASAEAVTLTAEKIVNGERDTMGVMEFTYDSAHRTWNSEFRNERVHALWTFTIRDTVMSGMLLDLPSKAVIRKVRVTRR